MSNNTDTLYCPKCETYKSPDDFYNNKRRKTGKGYTCKACDNARNKERAKTPKGRESSRRRTARYIENNPESHMAQRKAWQAKKKSIVEEYKADGCSVCGYNKCSRALDFHHTNPTDKDSSIADLVWNGSMQDLLTELTKCVVLCANCHREVHDD